MSFTDKQGETRKTGFLKRFTGMAVGDNEIAVDVTSEDESDRQTFRVVVRRDRPNLDHESERQGVLLGVVRRGNVEGASLAIEHGADPDSRIELGRGLEGTALTAAVVLGREIWPLPWSKPARMSTP